jgi:ribosomal-protein-alanine N-acetyltransferase
MRVIPITPEHLDAVHALECECYSDPWPRSVFAGEINDKHMIHYLVPDPSAAGTPAGYAFMRHIINEGHIQNIAVAPAYRKRGIASLLMDALLAEAAAREMIGITLEVRQGNRAAMALYHKYGFSVAGYRRGYYKDPPEDAVLMWKHLL